jgi:hypothetical protein
MASVKSKIGEPGPGGRDCAKVAEHLLNCFEFPAYAAAFSASNLLFEFIPIAGVKRH